MSATERDRTLRLATAVNSASDLETIVVRVRTAIRDLLSAEVVTLGLIDRERAAIQMHVVASQRATACGGRLLTRTDRVGLGADPRIDRIVVSGRSLLADVAAHGAELPELLVPELEAGRLLAVPLRGRDQIIGLLAITAEGTAALTEDAAEQVEGWAQLVGIAIENLRELQRAEALSLRDPLTGAFNRRYFEQALDAEFARCRRHGEGFALILADMDDLKGINDRFGHTAGDQALLQTIKLLDQSTRGADAVCRIAGDEFAILLPHTDRKQACAAASHLARVLRERNHWHGEGNTVVPVTLSMGYAVAPEDADEPAALVRCADAALYQAKDSGNARVVAYSGRPRRREPPRQA